MLPTISKFIESWPSVVFLCVIAINALILVPLTVYYVARIWRLRRDNFIHQRVPLVTILALVSWIIYILSFAILDRIHHFIPNSVMHLSLPIRLSCTNMIHITIVLMFLRVWYPYFRYKRGLHLVSLEFQNRLNASKINILSTQDYPRNYWTLRYPFLVHSWFLCSGALLWIILVQSVVILYPEHSDITQPIFISFPVIIATVMARKVRPDRDDLFIRKELSRYGFTTVIVAILYYTVR